MITGDTIACNQNSIVYKALIKGNCTAPAKWSLTPSIGNISILNDSMIQINFTSAGSAALKAVITSTCFNVTTAVNIKSVSSNANLNLGKDTSYCKGNSILLTVGNNFPYVLWNNNSTSNNLSVFSPGTYTVQVSTDSVCFLRDTVLITENLLPNIKLGNHSVICKPDSLILNAGAGFNSYLWQDGSAKPLYIAKDIGTYWVTVVDNKKCTNSDTIRITKIGSKPVNFVLFSDTAICTGEKITLKLNTSFSSYLWNNGANTTPAYEVASAGLYNISVTNNDGCTGNSSIKVIDRFCVSNIHIPNAFTPDRNNINDIFKPIFSRTPNFYKINIYNRYGQLVFNSNDFTKGWDGNYIGIPQDKGGYTWVINYRYSASSIIEKLFGSVLLIR